MSRISKSIINSLQMFMFKGGSKGLSGGIEIVIRFTPKLSQALDQCDVGFYEYFTI